MRVLAISLPVEAPTYVCLKPTSFLGKELFVEYQEATLGTVFDPKTKANLCPEHAWAQVHMQLEEAGFEVSCDGQAITWLNIAVFRQVKQDAAAEERILRMNAALASQGKVLRNYQLEGIRWLVRQRAALLTDEPGVGKTPQALVAIPENVGVIVDAPASLRLMWRDEIRRWRPDLSPLVNPENVDWPSPGQVYIISDSWVKTRVQTQPWRSLPKSLFLISDEAHRYKGRSARTDAMQSLCAEIRRNGGATMGLTGTPLQNRPAELYTLCLVFGAARKAFGGWGAYTKNWNCKRGRFKELIWGEPNEKIREGFARVSLRRTRAEVLPELPAKTWEAISSEASVRVLDALDRVDTEDVDRWERGEVEEPMCARDAGLRARLAKEKWDDCVEWIKRQEEDETDDTPLVVFSMHRFVVDKLKERPGWAVITGDTTPLRRNDAVSAFQAGKLRGIALTIQSGGVGLTLTAAHRVLFVDLPFNPAEVDQAEDRVCRFGQTRPVLISRLVTDHPLEKRLDAILWAKRQMARSVL